MMHFGFKLAATVFVDMRQDTIKTESGKKTLRERRSRDKDLRQGKYICEFTCKRGCRRPGPVSLEGDQVFVHLLQIWE